MIHVKLLSMLNVLYLYISTSRSMSAVPNVGVFCKACSSAVIDFPPDSKGYIYANALCVFHLCTLHEEGIIWTQFLLLFIFFGRGCAHCIIGVQFGNLNFWDFLLFLVIPYLKNCPSARSAIVTNLDCSGFDSFRNETTTSHLVIFDIGFGFLS
jgi:hypothetical protein